MGVLSGSSLISSAVSGLTNTYGVLASQNTDGTGLKIENLSNLTPTVVNQLGGAGNTFLSYLTSNFGSMDKNADGVISANELTEAANNMKAQGLTRDELSNLCSSMSNSKSYQTVLEYFDQIDTNGDGRVTDAEIRAFSYKAQRQKLDTQMHGVTASRYSLYYVDEGASNQTPTSVIDAMYPDL